MFGVLGVCLVFGGVLGFAVFGFWVWHSEIWGRILGLEFWALGFGFGLGLELRV